MERGVYRRLPHEDTNQGVYTVGDSIATEFYEGGWSTALNMMYEGGILPLELLDYLESLAHNYEKRLDQIYGGYFSPSFWLEIGIVYEEKDY